MFFSISKQPKDNYSHSTKMGDLWANTDEGWSTYQTSEWLVLYKGYADAGSLSDLVVNLLEQSVPATLGNFCLLAYNLLSKQILIKTDVYRAFPIYIGDEITNLTPSNKVVWSDGVISIDSELGVSETKFDILGSFDTSNVTVDHAVDFIVDRLDAKARKFVENNTLPIRVFLSGGVDSLLVYSFLQKYTDNYEVVNYSHIYYDKFWCKNSQVLQSNWAYKQIHHWQNPCVLTSGAPGDEFTMRSPTTIDLLLKAHGSGIMELLPEHKDSLHYDYFSLSKHTKVFESNPTPKIDNNLHRMLCNILVNDFQHWHLGNTLTWCPLRDIEITKMLLRIPVDQLIPQIMDSAISKRIIESNAPGLTKVLSDKKNTGNTLSNLSDFYDNILAKKSQ